MKKKLLIGTMLPVLAAAAVVGSGFALWVFENGLEAKNNQDISADITQLVAVGSIEKAGNLKLTFDQTAAKRQELGISNTNRAAGIQLTSDGEYNVNYTKATDGVDYSVDDGVSCKLTTTITITGDLASDFNISFKASANKAWTSTEAGKYVYEIDKTNADSCVMFNWNDLEFTYTKEPSNATEYNTLKAHVEAAEIKVEYSAVVTIAA